MPEDKDKWFNMVAYTEPAIPDEEMTCWTCPQKDTCDCAFDPYNTNGDCLANK